MSVPAPLPPRTVLVVDDSRTVAAHIANVLEASGRYKVVAQAHTGAEAVRFARATNPDLVCMDVVMPDMDGLHALRVIRMFNATAKVVMVTSVGGVAEVTRDCLAAGALAVVAKPVDDETLVATLDGL